MTDTDDRPYDLVTLGAGSGGVAASRRAAAHGARVAIVEAGRVGGTCVLRGCVPKKLLMYAAAGADELALAQGYGWHLGDAAPAFSMPRWAAAKAAETARLEQVYRQLLAGSGVALHEGRGVLDGRDADGCIGVRVETAPAEGGRADEGGAAATPAAPRRLRARHVLVATGARPARDAVPGLETCPTSDELLDLQALPAAAAVIGGGYIAVEFASMLARLGVPVRMHYRDRLPLRGFDEMLRTTAAAALQAAGVELHPGVMPTRIARAGGTAPAGAATGANAPANPGWLLLFGEERVVQVPWVLNGTGRRPWTEGLGLETLGVAPGARGAVEVGAGSRTAAPGLYAIGDVTARPALTPVAIAEGRALADTLFGGRPRQVDLSRVPSAVFMLPPLASVGPTEAEAAAAGRVRVYETDFRPMRQAFAGGRERTHMKLLVDDASDRVLAVHMAGADAPEIVQSLAVALTAGATKAHFDTTLAMHPTAAEEFVLLREPARVVGPGAA